MVLITGGNTGQSHSYLTPTQGQDSANYRGKYRVVTQLSHPYPGARRCLLQGEIQVSHTAISPLHRGKTVLITGGNTGWSHSYLTPTQGQDGTNYRGKHRSVTQLSLTPTQGQDSANYRGKYRLVTQLSHPYPGARQC